MIKESEVIEVNIEARVQKLFLNAIELLGGLKQLCDYRSLTWLPALARAAYAVVLKEEYNKTNIIKQMMKYLKKLDFQNSLSERYCNPILN